MTPILTTLKDQRYCLVQVPEGQVANEITHSGKKTVFWFDGYFEEYDIPEGNWSIIGLGRELTEDQWKGIVERARVMSIKYVNYLFERRSFYTATESGISWLTSLEATGDFLILKEQL